MVRRLQSSSSANGSSACSLKPLDLQSVMGTGVQMSRLRVNCFGLGPVTSPVLSSLSDGISRPMSNPPPSYDSAPWRAPSGPACATDPGSGSRSDSERLSDSAWGAATEDREYTLAMMQMTAPRNARRPAETKTTTNFIAPIEIYNKTAGCSFIDV